MEEALQSWRAEGHEIEVQYGEAAMESMRQAAVAGLQKVPKRGLEIGGVLLGAIDGDKVRIDQWREIECSHANGPGFDLSEADEKGLSEMLAEAADDPELAQFQIVGWYRTRTRGGAFLSDADIEFFNRFFPGEKQVAFVIRPHMYEPAQAGFFFREADGKVNGEASYAEFELENKRRRLPLGFDPARSPRRSTARPEDGSAGVAPEAANEGRYPARTTGSHLKLGFDPSDLSGTRAEGADSTPRRGSPWGGDSRKVTMVAAGPDPGWTRRRTVWVTALLAIIVLGVFLAVPAIQGFSESSLNLRARDLGGQLLVEWNWNAKALEGATGARIHIIDGAEERTLELSEGELRGGTVSYERKTGDVELHLIVLTGGRETASEITAYVGANPSPTANSPAGAQPSEFFTTEIERIKAEIESEKERFEKLRQEVDSEKRRLGSIR